MTSASYVSVKVSHNRSGRKVVAIFTRCMILLGHKPHILRGVKSSVPHFDDRSDAFFPYQAPIRRPVMVAIVVNLLESRVMYYSSRKPVIRVGLISTAPMRLAGLYGAFEDHPYLQIVFGDLDGILADPTLDFLILDVCSDSDGRSFHTRAQRARPDIRRIVLGPVEDDDTILRYLEEGARAYLDLNAGPLAVRQAVEAVTEGLIWAPRRILSKLIDRLMSHRQEVTVPRTRPVYSPRERQVLDLIMTASSNREIASELGIEERTVKAYVASLMRKTGVDNRVSLSVMAVRGSLHGQETYTS